MHRKQLAYIALAAGTALGLASVQLAAHSPAREQRGWASWYGPGFAGRQTASGERFSPQALTAAHRSLPLGTRAVVTNLETGQQVEVKINDRGPFADPGRRVIDLSQAAAKQIGLVRRGVGPVRVTVMDDTQARNVWQRGSPARARRRACAQSARRAVRRWPRQPLARGWWPHVSSRQGRAGAHPPRPLAHWTAGSRRTYAWLATEGHSTNTRGYSQEYPSA
jgi:rare lipoprotein A (peptidoglycan hydrolase)